MEPEGPLPFLIESASGLCPKKKTKKLKLRGFGPLANYADRFCPM
jgi:hypothetical protein